jgi:hypothetical protein
MPEQFPTNTLAVGGQSTLTGWDVLSDAPGFEEEASPYKNPNGSHKVDIVYSRRKTQELSLQAQYGTTPATLRAGGSVTYDGVLYRIRAFTPSRTHEPMSATLSLIAVADDISA